MAGVEREMREWVGKVKMLSFHSAPLPDDAKQTAELVYDRCFTPGPRAFSLLAPPRARGSHTRPPLKLHLPDTLVFLRNTPPLWFYSDGGGNCVCTSTFTVDDAVAAFVGAEEGESVVAVVKSFNSRPSLRDHSALVSLGCTTRVVNAFDFRASFLAAALGGREHDVAIQRFVRPRGPFAAFLRVAHTPGRPPRAWLVSNKARVLEEAHGGADGGADAQAAASARFCTTLAEPLSCSITQVCSGAIEPGVTEALGALHAHISAVSGRALDLLVSDFVSDGRRCWFLQLKAFRFSGVPPGHPFVLGPHARRYIDSDDHHDVQLLMSSSGGDEKRVPVRSARATRARAQCCGLCGSACASGDHPFQLTEQLLFGFRQRLRKRVSRDRFSACFDRGGFTAEFGTAGRGGSALRQYNSCQLCAM